MFDAVFRFVVMPSVGVIALVATIVQSRRLWREIKACV